MRRQEAACLADGGDLYDALLNDYEPGMKTAEVARVFEGLRPELVKLNQKIADAPKKPDVKIVRRLQSCPNNFSGGGEFPALP